MTPNFKKLLSIVAVMAILTLLSSVVFAQTSGKIAGTVTDQNNQALPGANVLVVGTTLGGSTDSEGRFFILNVPPGAYSLRVTFLGYKTVVKENVRVSVGLTAEANFKLESSVIEGEEVVVVAERPLVEKTLTASVSNYSADELNNTMPVATIQDLLETSPSVYRGFIRGGNKYETKTLVDGVDVSDSYFSQGQGAFGLEVGHSYQGMRPSDDRDNTGFTQSSGLVQELQVFAGTFNAEYPAATAGIINVVTKEGTPKYTFSLFNRTQATSGLSHKGSNIYHDSQGYFDEKATLAASADARQQRKATSYTWTPEKAKQDYNYDPATGKNLSRSHETNFTFAGPLTSKGGFFLEGSYSQQDLALPFDRTKRIGGSAKLHYNFAPGKKLTGMFQFTDGGELFNFVNWKYNPRYKYNMNGAPRYKDLNMVSYLKWSNTLSEKTFYEVQIAHTKILTETGYPDDDGNGFPSIDDTGDFIDFDNLNEYMKYVGGNGDPNTENGYKFGTEEPVFFSSTLNPSGWQKLNQAEYPVNGVSVNGQYLTWYPIALYQKFDRSRINVKADITSQVTYNHQVKSGISFTRHSVDVNTLQSELGGRGVEYPTSKFHVNQWKFNPLEFAAYIQDRIEYQGLIVNIGARLDGFDNDTQLFANEFRPLNIIRDANGDFLRYEPLRGDKVGWDFFFSPRVGVSHPVTDNLAMHYSFGRFFQYPNYASIYTDYNFQDYAASPTSPSVRPDQDPIRSTNYEIGAQWSPTNDLLITTTAYYRDVKNTSRRSYTLTTSENIGVFFNTTWGYSDARGIEIEVSKRPSKWWGGRISYAYTYVKQSIGAGAGTVRTAYSASQDSANFARLPWDDLEQLPTRERNILVTSGGTNMLAGGYDRPHRVNGTLQLFLPFDINANFIGEYTSGFYYQRYENVGEDPFFDRNQNLKIGPGSVFLNMRISKLINFSQLGVELFFEGRNIFNHTNIRGIANQSSPRSQDREIWELGRPDLANPGSRLTGEETDPEGALWQPTDVFGRLYYLNAREFYVGVNLSIR